jgi:cytochrome c-type biogenesis protein CcmH
LRRKAEPLHVAALLLLLGAGVIPAAAAPSDADSRTEALSAHIICNCDCGKKIVQTCYCGVADSLRAEIRSRVAAGDDDPGVLEYFVRKYGEEILAAPTPRGFNLAAWAAPATALIAGLLFAALLLRRWSRLAPAAAAPSAPPASAGSRPDPYEKQFEAEYAARED